jgi:hypothetical protein
LGQEVLQLTDRSVPQRYRFQIYPPPSDTRWMATSIIEHPDRIEIEVRPDRTDIGFGALSLFVMMVRLFPEPRFVWTGFLTVIAALYLIVVLRRQTIALFPDENRVTTRVFFLGLVPHAPKTFTVNGVHVIQHHKNKLPFLQMACSGRNVVVPAPFTVLRVLVRRGVLQQTEVDQLTERSPRELRSTRLVSLFVLLLVFNAPGITKTLRTLPINEPSFVPPNPLLGPGPLPTTTIPKLSSSPLVQAMNITNPTQLQCLDLTERSQANSMAHLMDCAPTETLQYFRLAHQNEMKTASDVELDCVTPEAINMLRTDTGLTPEYEEDLLEKTLDSISDSCGLSFQEARQFHDFWLEPRVEKSQESQT